MKTGKLILDNGREVVIGLEDTKDNWLTEQIMSVNGGSKLKRPLLFEDQYGNLTKTGQEINIKISKISAWSVADIEVEENE